MESYKDWGIECEIVETDDTLGGRVRIIRDGDRPDHFTFPVLGGFNSEEDACLAATAYARDWIDENY